MRSKATRFEFDELSLLDRDYTLVIVEEEASVYIYLCPLLLQSIYIYTYAHIPIFLFKNTWTIYVLNASA